MGRRRICLGKLGLSRMIGWKDAIGAYIEELLAEGVLKDGPIIEGENE